MADGIDESDDWNAVRLTEARQVAVLMDRDPEDWPVGQDVRSGYLLLRASANPSVAADYLAHALPRLEAIAWAARVVEDAAALDPPGPRQRRALDSALRWLGERTDAHRRAARAAAGDLRRPGSESALCMAVFYSGGSITDAGMAPVMPPDEAAGRYALAAVRACAYRSADAHAAFGRALDLGERIAERGLDALA